MTEQERAAYNAQLAQAQKIVQKVEPVIRVITITDDNDVSTLGYTLSGKVVVLAWWQTDISDADGNAMEAIQVEIIQPGKDNEELF